MSAAIAEVRAFLAGMTGSRPAPTQVPHVLRALVHRAARGRHDPDDLLQDLLADLLVTPANAKGDDRPAIPAMTGPRSDLG
jgi:hypothetical protein